jgi:hypothetical protein
MVEVGEARPGYELWRPNRESAQAKSTKAIVAFVLFVSAALLVIVTLGGWERLQSPGVGAITLVWAGLYVLFGFLVLGWNRGVLPVAASMAVIMLIFAAVAAPGWFDRAKDGLSSPALPEELLGLLTIVVIPVQLLLVAVAAIAFSQDWHVEEERPVGGGHDEAPPTDDYDEARPTDDYDEGPPSDDYDEGPPSDDYRDDEPVDDSEERSHWSPPSTGPSPTA